MRYIKNTVCAVGMLCLVFGGCCNHSADVSESTKPQTSPAAHFNTVLPEEMIITEPNADIPVEETNLSTCPTSETEEMQPTEVTIPADELEAEKDTYDSVEQLEENVDVSKEDLDLTPSVTEEPEETLPPVTESSSAEPLPTESVLLVLDYTAAENSGNQYAAETYGWDLDYSLNNDNAGFDFPYSATIEGIVERGGQDELERTMKKCVDGLYSTLSGRGDTYGYVISCKIENQGDDTLHFYVYYG